MRQLVKLMDTLQQRGIHFRSVTDSIDTATPMGRFVFHIMGRWLKWSENLLSNEPAQVLLPPELKDASVAADLS